MEQKKGRSSANREGAPERPWHENTIPLNSTPREATETGKYNDTNRSKDGDADGVLAARATTFESLHAWYRKTLIAVVIVLMGIVIINIAISRYRMVLYHSLMTREQANAQTHQQAQLFTEQNGAYRQCEMAGDLVKTFEILSGLLLARVRLDSVVTTNEGHRVAIRGASKDIDSALAFIHSLHVHFEDVDATFDDEESEDPEEFFFSLSFALAASGGANEED